MNAYSLKQNQARLFSQDGAIEKRNYYKKGVEELQQQFQAFV